jgi:Icc-related predicted phosphoesterase
MTACLFASDLHGSEGRYAALFQRLAAEAPAAVFLGGDLLPGLAPARAAADFLGDVLAAGFRGVRRALGSRYPRVFLILGNDDPRCHERTLRRMGADGLWSYAHGRRLEWSPWTVYGYACVPPTPFRLKDWERYDVSRFVDVGAVSPEEGARTVKVAPERIRWGTIQRDLERLTGRRRMARAIVLFHAPPYATALDRAALDGRAVDGVPLDPHVGSIAVRRFIEARQPRVTLHGHVHESARLTGSWRDRLGTTHAFSAAHDGPELALVRFDPERPEEAERELVLLSSGPCPAEAGARRR